MDLKSRVIFSLRLFTKCREHLLPTTDPLLPTPYHLSPIP